MTDRQAKVMAKRIADDLFQNGNGQKAGLLIMTTGSRDGASTLGGWCHPAVVARVYKILVGELKARKP